jgi:hypothetical protein
MSNTPNREDSLLAARFLITLSIFCGGFDIFGVFWGDFLLGWLAADILEKSAVRFNSPETNVIPCPYLSDQDSW